MFNARWILIFAKWEMRVNRMGVKKGANRRKMDKNGAQFFFSTYHSRAFLRMQADQICNVAKHFIKHLVHANCICIISYQLACEIVWMRKRGKEAKQCPTSSTHYAHFNYYYNICNLVAWETLHTLRCLFSVRAHCAITLKFCYAFNMYSFVENYSLEALENVRSFYFARRCVTLCTHSNAAEKWGQHEAKDLIRT